MATHVCGYSVACGGKWHDVWVELVRFMAEMALSVGRDGKACRWRLCGMWVEMAQFVGGDGAACGCEIAWHVDRDGMAYGRRWRGMWAEMVCGRRWRSL